MMEGKRFYKDFLQAKEGIATNILSDRLKKLEHNGIISSSVYEKKKTMKVYALTEKGKDLIPIVLEMIIWSAKYKDHLAVSPELLSKAQENRNSLVEAIKSNLA